MTGEGASATQFAGQSVTSHDRWFCSLNEAASRATFTATLIADNRQLGSPYVERSAASFKDH